jgi:glutathione peroxidase
LFEALGQRYGEDLIILGFPSREFGAQEFQTDEEIKAFAMSKNFPGILMKLGHVTGPGASEIWKFFMKATQRREPVWNFDGKFLVSKSGRILLPGRDVAADIATLMEEAA